MKGVVQLYDTSGVTTRVDVNVNRHEYFYYLILINVVILVRRYFTRTMFQRLHKGKTSYTIRISDNSLKLAQGLLLSHNRHCV